MKKRTSPAFAILLLAALGSLPAFAAPISGRIAEAPGDRPRLEKLLYRWEVRSLNLAELKRQAETSGRIRLHAGGQVFDLEIEPVDLRAPGFRQVLNTARGPVPQKPSAPATFKGHVVGDPDSIVRLLILPGLLQGYIKTADSWYFVDPLYKYARGAAPSKVVVFEQSDVRPEAGSLCGAGELEALAADLDTSDGRPFIAEGSGPFRRADIATEADFEYYTIYGGNANGQIQGVINQVDGLFQTYHTITLRIVFQSVWTTSSDPYTSSNDSTLLHQFKDYWNAHRSDVGRDLAHLFTGRDLDGATIGIAFVATACDRSFAYALSQDHSLMVKLVSHEIGHNLGAGHDSSGNPPADPCSGNGPIMCTPIQFNGPSSFSSRSQSEIASHVSGSGFCLDSVFIGPQGDPPVASFGWWQENTMTFHFDARASYDPDGWIVDYFWNFGDGSGFGSGASPSYTYSSYGCYDVELTVTDNQGNTASTTYRGVPAYWSGDGEGLCN